MGVFTTHGGHQEQTEIDSESFSRSVDDIRSSYVRPRSIWVCTRRSSVKFRFSAGRQRRYSQRCFFLTWAAYVRCMPNDVRRHENSHRPPQNGPSPFSGSSRCIAERHTAPRTCCTTGRLTPRKKRSRGSSNRSKRTSRFRQRRLPPFGAQHTGSADSLGAARRD
jgi:hypothetical protein